jgi:hypothetical protein
MHQFCRDRGFSFLLCLIPERLQVDERFRARVVKTYGHADACDYDWLKPQRALKDFCAHEGIELLDLTAELSEAGVKTPFYFEVDPHWNRAGHQRAAEAIFRRLSDGKSFPQTPARRPADRVK